MIKFTVCCDTCKKVFRDSDKKQISISEYTNGSLNMELRKAGWLLGRKGQRGKGYHVCGEECRKELLTAIIYKEDA